MSVPELRTRRPSGKPPWPMLCIAGVEKSGKSYAACDFSKSDLIDRTLYIELGEGAADQNGEIPGARYEIVEHDGTFNSILGQAQAAVAAPRGDRPHAIVVDSLTELWDLLSDEAQAKANRRAAQKAAEKKRQAPAEDVQITMDLWNEAKKKWRRFLDTLRMYDGPVILLARLELVAVVEGGKPSEQREWKIRAEKNLAFECDAIVKMYAPQSAFLTGVRSTRLQVPPGKELPQPQFSIDGLLRALGLDQVSATAPRSYTAPRVDLDGAPDVPMQRQSPRADDEWNTGSGRPVAAPSPTVQFVTGKQLAELDRLLRVKRGAVNGARQGIIEQLVQRPVPDPQALSQAEARSIIETLAAEPDRPVPDAAPAEAAVGTPNNPAITAPQQRALHALLGKAGYGDRAKGLELLSRYVGRPLESSEHLSKAEASSIIDKLSNGELPSSGSEPAGPDVLGEGIAEYDVLDQMILDVTSDEARAEVEQAITVELARGTITATGAGVLRRRLAEHVAQAKAGASA